MSINFTQVLKSVLQNKDFAKFILLDQYGFSEIDESIFQQLIEYPKTDFIFFISSSYISRFREHENTKKYINTDKIKFEDIKPNEIHRSIAKYYSDLIPNDKEYYLHHFSIQKEENKGNYYGLIFGSNHTLGMEKFLKVCWEKDKQAGEASYNIDNNFDANTLFGSLTPIKIDDVKREVEDKVLSGHLKSNIEGFKYVMKKGCLPKLFTEVVRKLEVRKLIRRVGDVNYQSTNIHKVKEYQIILLKNGK